jgi:hypothetical protein
MNNEQNGLTLKEQVATKTGKCTTNAAAPGGYIKLK